VIEERAVSARSAVAGCVVVVVAIVVWISMSRRPASDGRAAKAAPVAALPSAPTEIAAESAAQGTCPTRSPSETTSADELPSSTESGVAPDSVRSIEGRIVVCGRDDVELAGESGTFIPVFTVHRMVNGRASESVEAQWSTVAVTNGVFHFDATDASRLDGTHVILGGKAATIRDSVPITTGTTPVLRARFIEPIRLHVVDAVTRSELDEIVVGHSNDFRRWRLAHPIRLSAEETIVVHAVSPLMLAPTIENGVVLDEDRYWIGARGHAWTQTEIRFDAAADVVVPLAPSAVLVVEIDGVLPRRSPAEIEAARRPALFDPALSGEAQKVPQPETAQDDPDALLRVSALPPNPVYATPRRVLESRAQLGETRIDDLPPGEIEVTVETDTDPPRIAGTATTTLIAGETRIVSLHVTDVQPAAKVPLAGRLLLPVCWKQKGVTLDIDAADSRSVLDFDSVEIALHEMTEVPDRPGTWLWRSSPVVPGRYRITVEPTGFACVIDVGKSGCEDLELVVRDAAAIRVQFLAKENGEAVRVEQPIWFGAPDPTAPDARHDSSRILLQPDADGVGFHGEVPLGPARFRFFSRSWMPVDRDATYAVHAGEQDLVVAVSRVQGTTFHFRIDHEPALAPDGSPIDERWLMQLEWTTAGGKETRPTRWIERGVGVTYVVPETGRYRVTIPKLPGYAAVAPIDVEILEGVLEVTDVALVRE
jgi:hypothetical protein